MIIYAHFAWNDHFAVFFFSLSLSLLCSSDFYRFASFVMQRYTKKNRSAKQKKVMEKNKWPLWHRKHKKTQEMHLIWFKWANDGACFGFAYGLSSTIHCMECRRRGASIVYIVRNMHLAVVWPFKLQSSWSRFSCSVNRAYLKIGFLFKIVSDMIFGCGINFIYYKPSIRDTS